MGNLIITNAFIVPSVSAVTIPNLASGYAISDLFMYGSLARHIRTTNTTVNTTLLTIDFGAAVSIAAVFLNDCNFGKINILGCSDGLFSGGFSLSCDIGMDPVVGRRKLFAALSGFSYRYFRLFLPATAAVTDGAGYFRLSSLVIMSSAAPLSVNMDYEFERGAGTPFHTTEFDYGGDERLSLGETLKYACAVQFGARSLAAENELWALNRMSISGRLVFHENMGDASRAYIVIRDDSYSGTIIRNNRVTGGTIRFKEQI